jgi:hypothetical protein
MSADDALSQTNRPRQCFVALVLGGVGLVLVHAARLVERLPATQLVGRSSAVLQVGIAMVVIVLGVVLTGQALTQVL